MPKSRRQGGTRTNHAAEKQAFNLHEDLEEFEKFQKDILKAIRRDLSSGLSAKQIREKYHAMVQARLLTVALTDTDTGKATAASKDIIDRVEGRAVEKKDVTHRFKDMSDQELDAVLKSETEDLKDMQERFEQ